MRGRKPTPTFLKVIAGNPGKRPLPPDEPQPPGELLAPPDWFSEEQRKGWRYVIDHAPKGMLRRLDASALAVWVIAEDLHRQATMALREDGLIVKSKTGVPMQSHYLPIINKQAQLMLKAASELGFTPTSRSRITLGGSTSKKETNRFAVNAARRA